LIAALRAALSNNNDNGLFRAIPGRDEVA